MKYVINIDNSYIRVDKDTVSIVDNECDATQYESDQEAMNAYIKHMLKISNLIDNDQFNVSITTAKPISVIDLFRRN